MKRNMKTERVIKEKFLEQRETSIRLKPLIPLNEAQKEYVRLLEEKPIVIATGFAGTSKSYIPAVIAADMLKLGQIERIMFTRPALSNSQSLGFFSGSAAEKLTVWLGSVIPVLKERLGPAAYDTAVSSGNISFIPLEVVKGLSLNNTFFICEEASDLTKDEIIKLITRIGKNSTLVLAGDILQSELKQNSGLTWLTQHVTKHTNLKKNFGFVDFNSVNHIVRSDAVKDFIISLQKDLKV